MPPTSIEDLLKTIFGLEVAKKRPSTKAVADVLDIPMASVTGMVKKLAADGLLEHVPYHGFELTATGRQLALRMLRRHRLIELFLMQTLGLGWDEVHADAEVMEHAVSDQLVERIYTYLGKPEFDPHGSPIPDSDGAVAVRSGVPVAQLAAGDEGIVSEVEDEDPEFLRYLSSLGIKIGSPLRVMAKDPYGGLVGLRVGKRSVSMGTEAAQRVRVARSNV
ncbi:MAG: metal-dependent transcriptional regulator [Planctomycetes bacterium]|nr:metal-dependent transcriptional regulator [Planctomycetota bacterium]